VILYFSLRRCGLKNKSPQRRKVRKEKNKTTEFFLRN